MHREGGWSNMSFNGVGGGSVKSNGRQYGEVFSK